MDSFVCRCGRLVAKEWSFCAECGRHAGEIDLPHAALEFEIVASRPAEKAVLLRNRGVQPVAYEAYVEPGNLVQVAPELGEIAPGEHSLTLTIRGVPPRDQPPLLYLITYDGERPPEDPWAPPVLRKHPPVPLSIQAVAAPRLRALPEMLVLTDEHPLRNLVLENTGRDAIHAVLPALPAGFVYAETDQHRAHVSLAIAAGASQAVPIALAGVSRETLSTILVRTDLDQEVPVDLVRQTRPGEAIMPAYVIGIDFGTWNSSVYVRRVGRGSAPDEIHPAVLIQDEGSRFPSALYQAVDGTWHFGFQALAKAETDGYPDRVIRGVKTLIREQEEKYLDRGPDFARASLLTRFLGYLRSRAREFVLRQWGDELDDLEILYVCTIPVLDDERQQQVIREMGPAVRQALLPESRRHEPLENWVRFAPEPLAAALYIILDRERIAIHGDHRVVVFDSGGGTTDVVVGRVEVEQGRVHFHLEDQIGLDAAGNTFGGVDVTGRLIDPVIADRTGLRDNLQADPAWQEASLRLSESAWDLFRKDLGVFEKFDRLKTAVLRGDREAAELDRAFPSPVLWAQVPREEQIVVEQDVNAAVLPFLDPVLDPVRQRFFESGGTEPARFRREEINHIFPVGGNTLIPRVRLALRRLFHAPADPEQDRLVEMPEGEVMEAVARGAVLVPDANLKNYASYSIELIRIAGAHEEMLWPASPNAAVRASRKAVTRQFENQPQRIVLRARFGERTRVLEDRTILPPHARCQLLYLWMTMDVQESPTFRVEYSIDPAGRPRPEHELFRYVV